MIEIQSSKIDEEVLLNELNHIINTSKKNPPKTKKRENSDDQESESTLDPNKSVYTIEDFHQYHDVEFITNIYRVVLQREVDLEALTQRVMLLRTGKRSKTEILSSIRFSKEGRAKNIPILGIKKRYLMSLVYRVPVVGYVTKLFVTLLSLPKIVEKQNRLEAHHFMNQQQLQQELNQKVKLSDFKSEITQKVNLSDFKSEITQKVNLSDFKSEINQKVNLSDFKSEINQKVNLSDLQKEIQNMEQHLSEKVNTLNKEIHYAKHYLREVENNLKQLIDKAEGKLENIDTDFLTQIVEEKHAMLDSLYIAFEDKFRGSREAIKTRQNYYIPLVKKHITEKNDLVVDLGSGRGEWIELLQENSIQAQGVDLNRLMVSESQNYGLDVVQSDAIKYLKGLEAESVAVLTGFHIVEHLPFETLIALFDEALRVLKKGGMIIFETPNPENLFVGACSFYTDPTHINPIPPATLEFLASNRGFAKLEIHRLHPLKEASFLEGENTQDINHLIQRSTQAQDYSIIGYKI